MHVYCVCSIPGDMLAVDAALPVEGDGPGHPALLLPAHRDLLHLVHLVLHQPELVPHGQFAQQAVDAAAAGLENPFLISIILYFRYTLGTLLKTRM